MSLRERAEVTPGRHRAGLPCSVATAMAVLDADDLEVLDRWLSTPVGHPGRRSDRAIAADLTAETGIRVSSWTVGNHRRRACRCT